MSTTAESSASVAVQTDLAIVGMTCGACASRVERHLNKIDGVNATVNFATRKASVAHPKTATVDELIDVVKGAGYAAHIPATASAELEAAEAAQLAEQRYRLVACAGLSLPVVAMAMVPALQFLYWQWVSLVLAMPVVVWGGQQFHEAALHHLRRGTATMDTLVSIGSLAAFCWSLYALIFGTAGNRGLTHDFHFSLNLSDGSNLIYLEVAAAVVTSVLAGRYVEMKARGRSGAALRAMFALAAKDAVVLRDGHEIRIPIDQLLVGDLFVARPAEKIATDGVVQHGVSTLDMSMMTGEALPVEVTVGDAVVGGCINASGRLVVRATRVGAETQLAQMAALVEQAQTGKAAVQRLADRISAQFVPVVVVLAAAAGTFWLGVGVGPAVALSAAVAVLIVACPCALGLATPTALLVGTGRGAQLGILVSGPEALESTKRVDTIVLDKTGTLTTGAMTVTEVVVAAGEDVEQVTAIAGAVEAASNHPIARAITRHATELGDVPPVSEVTALDGLGMAGTVDGRKVLIGRPVLMTKQGMTLPAPLEAAVSTAQERGCTAAVLAWSGQARAVLIVADTVRPTSAAAVAELRRLGLEPILLTGDNSGVALTVAEEVGIDTVIADALPAGKVEIVQRLQAQGRTVAMVGDGVNDGAALAQADLGLAMGTGSDVAIHASDLTLVRSDLTAAVDAIRLSRRTLKVIKGNLFWAFAYNYLALPIAAAGVLNPMLAGAAMALSSVFVVTNSLRLRRFTAWQWQVGQVQE